MADNSMIFSNTLMQPGGVNSPNLCKVHTDDIPVPVLEPGSGKTRTARLWVYVRDGRNAGSQLSSAVWFMVRKRTTGN